MLGCAQFMLLLLSACQGPGQRTPYKCHGAGGPTSLHLVELVVVSKSELAWLLILLLSHWKASGCNGSNSSFYCTGTGIWLLYAYVMRFETVASWFHWFEENCFAQLQPLLEDLSGVANYWILSIKGIAMQHFCTFWEVIGRGNPFCQKMQQQQGYDRWMQASVQCQCHQKSNPCSADSKTTAKTRRQWNSFRKKEKYIVDT